jgi:hypothetical protein
METNKENYILDLDRKEKCIVRSRENGAVFFFDMKEKTLKNSELTSKSPNSGSATSIRRP